MAVEVTLTIASVGCWMVGSGTSSTRTSELPCQVSARIVLLLPRPATGPSGVVVTDLHAKPDEGCVAR